MWNKAKTQEKAATAAKTAAGGVVVAGGGVVAALAFLRSLTGLPWPVEGDAAIAGVVTLVGVPLWTWLRTYLRDRARHGGAAEPGTLTPLIVLVCAVLALGAGPCATLTHTPDGWQMSVDAEAAIVAANALTLLGDHGVAFYERIETLREARDTARTERERAERDARLREYPAEPEPTPAAPSLPST